MTKVQDEVSLQGDFHHLYQEMAPWIYTYLLRQCQDKELAEELCQETFLSVYRALDSFEGRSSLKTWVYAIATNKLRDHFRTSKGRVEQGSEDIDLFESSSPNPENLTISGLDLQRVRQAVLELPPKLRTVLLLTRFEGLKYREAAEVLGVPISTVRMRLYNSIQKLIQKLEE